jgi:hypothetical protein
MKKLTCLVVFCLSLFYTFSQSDFSIEGAVRYLASPELEGRKIQTKGDTLTIQFLVNQFEKMGIKPFFSQYEHPFCAKSIMTAQKNELCSKNIVAYVEGTDKKLKEQYILICAHFDHIGKVKSVFFPGANDNASGTAAVLYLANYFAKNPTNRSLIFACFAGEELGFLGSSNFIKDFPQPLNMIKYVINFDMVGRYDLGGISIMGKESSKILDKTVRKISDKEAITIVPSGAIFFEGSDHYQFYKKNIPFLCFNTGNDKNNYHTPRDRTDSIDYKGIKTIADFAKKIIEELGSDSKDPDFRKIDSKKLKVDNGELLLMVLSGVTNKFGFIFNFSEECGNEIEIVKITEKGADAGLMKGDKVIKINGKEFQCSKDYLDLVKTEKEKPYKLTIARDGEVMEIGVE